MRKILKVKMKIIKEIRQTGGKRPQNNVTSGDKNSKKKIQQIQHIRTLKVLLKTLVKMLIKL